MKKNITILTLGVAALALGISNASAQGHTNGVHCEHFSKTGDTVCYDRVTGAALAHSKGYSGQPGYQNNPSTSNLRNKGTIPSGTYDINGVSPILNGRHHRTGNVILEPRSSTNTHGRSGFRMHGGTYNDNGYGGKYSSQDSSAGCIITKPNVRQTIRSQGGHGTVTVQPSYPQSRYHGGLRH